MASDFITGGIWRTRPVTEEPNLRLRAWSIRRVKKDGHCHFVGYNDAFQEGRVSSHIVEFDPERLRGVTRSGRVYQLSPGMAGTNGDAEYVWSRWCAINGVTNDEEGWEFVDIDQVKTTNDTTSSEG